MSAIVYEAPDQEMVIEEDRTNLDMFDRFSLVHMGFGAVCGYLGAGPLLVGVTAIGWEVAENPLKDRFPEVFPHATHDTLLNATGDVLATMVGWAIGRALRGGSS